MRSWFACFLVLAATALTRFHGPTESSQPKDSRPTAEGVRPPPRALLESQAEIPVDTGLADQRDSAHDAHQETFPGADLEKLSEDARADENSISLVMNDEPSLAADAPEPSEDERAARRFDLVAKALTQDRWSQIERRTGVDYRRLFEQHYGEAD